MFKELFVELANYHFWANQRLLTRCQQLEEGLVDREVASSFPTLTKTWIHMWNAESLWMQRLKLEASPKPPGEGFSGNFGELSGQLLLSNSAYKDFLARMTDAGLTHVVEYYNLKKEHFKMPVYHCLMQVFNHATYHRGQVVTILRMLGADKIPATDFIAFCRSVK